MCQNQQNVKLQTRWCPSRRRSWQSLHSIECWTNGDYLQPQSDVDFNSVNIWKISRYASKLNPTKPTDWSRSFVITIYKNLLGYLILTHTSLYPRGQFPQRCLGVGVSPRGFFLLGMGMAPCCWEIKTQLCHLGCPAKCQFVKNSMNNYLYTIV